jgi:hypothetical protein
MTRGQLAVLVLRVATEVAVVLALGYWGYASGVDTPTRVALMLLAPALGFGTWGAVDFRHAGRLAEPLRLIEELVISGVAAGLLYVVGQRSLAVLLAALTAVYHASVYVTGNRLLGKEG